MPLQASQFEKKFVCGLKLSNRLRRTEHRAEADGVETDKEKAHLERMQDARSRSRKERPECAIQFIKKAALADGFKDLNRPLAPLFVPLAAISTGVSWPGDEFGGSISFGRRRWSIKALGSIKSAYVTGDKTGTVGVTGDFRWTSHFTNALRFSNLSTLGTATTTTASSSEIQPVQTYGLDFIFSI